MAKRIRVTAEVLDILRGAITATTGEDADIRAHYGKNSPYLECVAYYGSNPAVLVFELAVIKAGRVMTSARNAGYEYTPADVIDELRNFISQIDSPQTEAIGSQLVYYWPSLMIER